MSKEIKISQNKLILYSIGIVAVTAFLTAVFMAKPDEEEQSNAAGGSIRRAFRRMWRKDKPKFGGGGNVPLYPGVTADPEKKDVETLAENNQAT